MTLGASREIASPAVHSVKDCEKRRPFVEAFLFIGLLAILGFLCFTGPDGIGGVKHRR